MSLFIVPTQHNIYTFNIGINMYIIKYSVSFNNNINNKNAHKNNLITFLFCEHQYEFQN